MLVTEFGMVMLVRPVQQKNAPSLMLVTEFGIIVVLQPCIKVFVAVSIIALQLSLLSNIVFPVSTVIFTKLLHFINAASPIPNTDLGILILVKLLQLANERPPINFTEFPIVILVNHEPLINAYSPIIVTLSGIVKSIFAAMPVLNIAVRHYGNSTSVIKHGDTSFPMPPTSVGPSLYPSSLSPEPIFVILLSHVNIKYSLSES